MITKQHRPGKHFAGRMREPVAAQAGLLCVKTEPDYGIDLSLRTG